MKSLVSGVTRWRRRLDYTAAKLCNRNMTAVEPGMRQARGLRARCVLGC